MTRASAAAVGLSVGEAVTDSRLYMLGHYICANKNIGESEG